MPAPHRARSHPGVDPTAPATLMTFRLTRSGPGHSSGPREPSPHQWSPHPAPVGVSAVPTAAATPAPRPARALSAVFPTPSAWNRPRREAKPPTPGSRRARPRQSARHRADHSRQHGPRQPDASIWRRQEEGPSAHAARGPPAQTNALAPPTTSTPRLTGTASAART